jgi:hypothetical protein
MPIIVFERMLHKVCLAGAAVLVTTSFVAADVKRLEFIPAALRGTWATAGGCGKSDTRMVITDKTYDLGKAHCTVDWVSEIPANEGSIYSARLKCATPGKAQPTIQSRILWPKAAGHVSIGTNFEDLQDYAPCQGQ